MTKTTTISESVVSRKAYLASLARRAADPKTAELAMAILLDSKAQATNYVPFLQSQASSHKLTLVDVVAVLSTEDCEFVLSELRPGKGEEPCPQLATFKAALTEARSMAPVECELHEAGSIEIGKKPSVCTMITAYPTLDGTRTKKMFGLKMWSWIVSMTDSDRAAIRSLLDKASTNGWK